MNASHRISARPKAVAATAVLAALLSSACNVGPDPATDACLSEERALQYGFYSDFAPVSYSVDPDPGSPGHDQHAGYEADLLTALEAMTGTGVVLDRHAIDPWPDIWLRPSRGEFDFVGGGITILESRTQGASGETAVAFTSGHISFRQSLLVRAEDADRIRSYEDLADAAVAVLTGTTGEHRLLELTGVVDDGGVLAAGTTVHLADGSTVVADGTDAFRITAAGASANLEGRTRLDGPPGTVGRVVYHSSDEGQVVSLRDGVVDAVARGEIANRAAAAASEGALVVAALDARIELGGFAFDIADSELAECIDGRLNFLTDDRRIGVAEWFADPTIFMSRARRWGDG